MWNRILLTACFAVLLLIVMPAARAQQAADTTRSDVPAEVAPQYASRAIPSARLPTTILPTTHRFWDKENDWLFAGVAASRGLDYASTLNLRRRGINEALLTNSIVDNHPLFGGIEAMATAASIGVSYLFHTTGHHRLERWTSAVHIGVATGGAVRNYLLKTPH